MNEEQWIARSLRPVMHLTFRQVHEGAFHALSVQLREEVPVVRCWPPTAKHPLFTLPRRLRSAAAGYSHELADAFQILQVEHQLGKAVASVSGQHPLSIATELVQEFV